jgi:DNA-binding GntR family transcriptional regulator
MPAAKIIYYKGEVPLRPVIDLLQQYQATESQKQARELTIAVNAPVMTLQQLAAETKLLRETILGNLDKISTHRLIGETFVKTDLLDDIRSHLNREIGDAEVSLTAAMAKLEKYDLPDPAAVLAYCGYKTVWHGISMDTAVVKKA